jgi:hypothetical protein
MAYHLWHHRRISILNKAGGVTMRISSTILALALSTSVALAAEVGPLPQGAPAGVKHAQSSDNTLLYAALGAGLVAFIGFVIAQGGSTTLSPVVNQSSTTTTGTTG